MGKLGVKEKSDIHRIGQFLKTGVTAGSYGNGSFVATFTVDAFGRLTAAGSVPISGSGSTFAFTGIISVPSVSALTNNWNPTGIATANVIRVGGAGSSASISGLVGGANGRIMWIENVDTSNQYQLLHENGGSTAANRFHLPNNIAYIIGAGCSVMLWYDSTQSRWLVAAHSFSTNAGATFSDVSGTYPALTVVSINGVPLGATTATSGNLLIASGTNWVSEPVTGDITLTSAGLVTVTQWQGVSVGLAAATAGHVMIGSGTQWVSRGIGGDMTLASGGVATVSASLKTGRLVQSNVITSGTTFTTQATTNTIKIRGVAAGGGGGGCASAAASAATGGGGSAGGYFEKLVTVNPSTGYTIAIGTGGTAGASTGGTGGTGGNTTITVGATTYTANGGIGGVGSVAGTTFAFTAGGASPAISTNGDLNSAGEAGDNGIRNNGTIGVSGSGGSGQLGSGGGTLTAAAAGKNGIGFGSGGGGALVLNGSAAVAGGVGAGGCLVIDEYT